MFKIDKSSVEFIDSNKSAVVIKYWSPQDNRFDENSLDEQKNASVSQKKNQQPTEKKPISEQDVNTPQKILENAYTEAEQIKASAWNEGYNHGLEEAKKNYEAYLKHIKEIFDRSMLEIEAFQESVLSELEESTLQLSFDIAEKIVNIQLEKDDILFVDIIKKAIEKLNAREKFTIRLNEIQIEKYFRNGADWLIEELQCPPFTAVKDPGVAPNGCVLESDEGIIDAGAGNQLKMLLRTMDREESQYDEAL